MKKNYTNIILLVLLSTSWVSANAIDYCITDTSMKNDSIARKILPKLFEYTVIEHAHPKAGTPWKYSITTTVDQYNKIKIGPLKYSKSIINAKIKNDLVDLYINQNEELADSVVFSLVGVFTNPVTGIAAGLIPSVISRFSNASALRDSISIGDYLIYLEEFENNSLNRKLLLNSGKEMKLLISESCPLQK